MFGKCIVGIEDAECSFPVKVDRLYGIEAAGEDCLAKISDISRIIEMKDVFRVQNFDTLRVTAQLLLGILAR